MLINILIADDHQYVRQSLKAFLESEGFRVVGEAANRQEALQLVETLGPDVAILAMPILNGIEAVREIQCNFPKTRTILLTMNADSRYILEGLRAGAKGYVMKTQVAEDLVRAIRETARGGMYLSPGITEELFQGWRYQTETSADPLSARERQVLQLIAEGKTTKEIATILAISVKTGETYRTRVREKLNLHMTADLVRYAIRRGFIQP